MRKLWLLVFGMLLFMLPETGLPQQKEGSSRPVVVRRVKVIVSAPNTMKSLVESYVKRELRELDDVAIVESNPQWTIEIGAFEPKLLEGRKVGVVLSVVISKTIIEGRKATISYISRITKQLENDLVALREKYNKKLKKVKKVKEMLTLNKLLDEEHKLLCIYSDLLLISSYLEEGGFSRIVTHDLVTGPPESLKSLCEEIVAEFDTNFLEPERRLIEQLIQNTKP